MRNSANPCTSPLCALAPEQYSGRIAFDRLYCHDFYDGPTSGILRCACCLREFAFVMLDWNVDRGSEWIFGLTVLQESLLETIDGIYRQADINPTTPAWYGNWTLAPDVRNEVMQLVDAALSACQSVESVFAPSDNCILESEGMALAPVPAGFIPAKNPQQGFTAHFWFENETPTANWRDLLS